MIRVQRYVAAAVVGLIPSMVTAQEVGMPPLFLRCITQSKINNGAPLSLESNTLKVAGGKMWRWNALDRKFGSFCENDRATCRYEFTRESITETGTMEKIEIMTKIDRMTGEYFGWLKVNIPEGHTDETHGVCEVTDDPSLKSHLF